MNQLTHNQSLLLNKALALINAIKQSHDNASFDRFMFNLAENAETTLGALLIALTNIETLKNLENESL